MFDRHLARLVLERLGSMSLAVVLLIVLATASAIGTVLLQQQEHEDYFAEFGPLWYWAFRSIGLFDMYHAWWFLFLLAFLMVSLAACLWRNTPKMLKEMKTKKPWISERHINHLKIKHHFSIVDEEKLISQIKKELSGWRIEELEAEGVRFLRADAGWWNKWGYVLAHAGILVILIGGWVSVQFGFRGNMAVVEGGVEDTISFLRGTKTEHLKLPFAIRCNDFSIDFYPTGQPKEFRSSLTIIDHGKEVLTRDIVVNEPLEYKGVRIYQASFGDGGSMLKLKLLPLGEGKAKTITSRVYETWKDPETGLSLEFTDFKPFNVENIADPGKPKEFRDLGPAVEMIVRAPNVRPVKVKLFMNPFIDLEGTNRGSFMMISFSGDAKDYQTLALGIDLTNPKEWKLLQAFLRELKKVRNDANIPKEKRTLTAFKRALEEVFGSERPEDLPAIGMRVLQAAQVIPQLPWPYLPVLIDYDQVYYTGLQLTKDPGMNIVWFGSALLVLGLGIMFYMPHRRIWLRLQEKRGILAAATNRGELDCALFVHELFTKLVEAGAIQPRQQATGKKRRGGSR